MTTTTLTGQQQDYFFDLACGGTPGLYGVGPVAEAAHNAYAALAAVKPDGFDYHRRAKDLGVR